VRNQTFKKYKKLYHKASKENRRTKFLSKRFSELNINYLKRIKIDVKNISLNLDERFWNSEGNHHFDEFIMITTPYKISNFRYGKLRVPIKHHHHSNKFKDWSRKNTVRLRNKNGLYLDFIYEKEQTPLKSTGSTIGFDSGYKKLLVDSNGQKHGQHLEEVYTKLSRKKRGSKNYKGLLIHKKNEINRVINNLELSNVNQVVLEDLKNVKHKSKFSKKFNNKLQYWSFRQVIDKLCSRSEIEGFYVHFVNPAYTSQTCSTCGVVDKSNRKGEVYQCTSCGSLIDADYNAAINILNRGAYNPSDNENEFIDFDRNS
jgi:IS605 OrfB family transposase